MRIHSFNIFPDGPPPMIVLKLFVMYNLKQHYNYYTFKVFSDNFFILLNFLIHLFRCFKLRPQKQNIFFWKSCCIYFSLRDTNIISLNMLCRILPRYNIIHFTNVFNVLTFHFAHFREKSCLPSINCMNIIIS